MFVDGCRRALTLADFAVTLHYAPCPLGQSRLRTYMVARTPTAARNQSMVLAIPLCCMAASYGRKCGESRRLTGKYWLILWCLLVDYSFLLMAITRPFIVSTALVMASRSSSVPRLAFVGVCESDDAYSPTARPLETDATVEMAALPF